MKFTSKQGKPLQDPQRLVCDAEDRPGVDQLDAPAQSPVEPKPAGMARQRLLGSKPEMMLSGMH